MEINTREKNNYTVVDLDGKFDTGTSPKVESALKEVSSKGDTKILISFDKVSYISSAGLRVLLSFAKSLKSLDGNLRICRLNEVTKEVFEVSGFSSILNVYDKEDDALIES